MHIVLVDHLQETKKEYKNFKKKEIHDIFIKMNQIKLVFSMTWLMEILKISLEEQLPIKYCVIEHLILLKIQNMMDTEGALLQWSIIFLIKNLLLLYGQGPYGWILWLCELREVNLLPVVVLKIRIFKTKNHLKN